MVMENTPDPHNLSKLNRRTFIASAAAGATGVGLALSNQAAGSPEPPLARSKIRWRLQAQRVEQTFGDGATIPFFRFVAVGNSPSNGNLPLMRALAGTEQAVSIENLVDFPIQPMIRDHETGPVIMPNEKAVWKFTMPTEGVWMFTESLLGNVAPAIGFAAPLISTVPKLATRQTTYILVYQDADDRWNNAVDTGSVPDESVFEPNYHTLNGLSHPATMSDNDTRICCQLGETVLIRMMNFGNINHAVHLHGYHAQIIRINNVDNSMFPPKDSFQLPPYASLDIEMHVDQIGEYPVHLHSLTSVTDNGIYPGGSLTMIDAQS